MTLESGASVRDPGDLGEYSGIGHRRRVSVDVADGKERLWVWLGLLQRTVHEGSLTGALMTRGVFWGV